jgi:hypothetical protein
MFRLSLLSINQLDTARYTCTFGCSKCFISYLPITITGNRINDLYIISYATAVILPVPTISTKSTSRRRKNKRKQVSSSTHTTVTSSRAHITTPASSAHTTEPSIVPSNEPTTRPLHSASPYAASTVPQCPAATESPKHLRKLLTITESQLWHCRRSHIDPTTLRSLIDGYTSNDSMCTACIQAQYKQKTIKVKIKHTTKQYELVHSDVWGPFSMPTSASNHYYILFIDNYTRYTSVWVLPDKKSKTSTSGYKAFQDRVDSRGYELRRFRCDNGSRGSENKTFRQVLTARCTAYKLCTPYAHHKHGVAKRMIQSITGKARSMMINFQVPLVFCGDAVKTAMYLHQPTPNEGTTKRDDHHAYQGPYSTPYKMLQAFGKPSHNNDGNDIWYKAPLQHLNRFGSDVS